MSLENLVNNDKVCVLYKAVYKTEQPTTKCDVDIEYVSMDDSYGKSYNYEIDETESVKTFPAVELIIGNLQLLKL